jgi:hypothetical protein
VPLHEQCLAQSMYSDCHDALHGCIHVPAISRATEGSYYMGLYGVTVISLAQRMSSLPCAVSGTDLSYAVLLTYQSKPMIAQGREGVGASRAQIRDACLAGFGGKVGHRMIPALGRSCQLISC